MMVMMMMILFTMANVWGAANTLQSHSEKLLNHLLNEDC